ncbi:unnamed protein product [Closterium sp. Naga37s-1]|nr:unnamed protein product [Closterium sp. Naga37s-1]
MGNAEQKGHVTVTEEGEHVIITEAAERDGIWAVDGEGSGDGDVGVQVDAYVDADVDDADVDAFSEDMHLLWDVLAIDDAAQRAARMAELGYEVYIEDGLEGYRKAGVEDSTNSAIPAPLPGNALDARLAEEAAERRQLEQRLESAQKAVGALLTCLKRVRHVLEAPGDGRTRGEGEREGKGGAQEVTGGAHGGKGGGGEIKLEWAMVECVSTMAAIEARVAQQRQAEHRQAQPRQAQREGRAGGEVWGEGGGGRGAGKIEAIRETGDGANGGGGLAVTGRMEEGSEVGGVGGRGRAGGAQGVGGMGGVGGAEGVQEMRESELLREVSEVRRENEALKQLLLLAFQGQGAADLPQLLPQLLAQSHIPPEPAEKVAYAAETALAATMSTETTTDGSTAATSSSDAGTGTDTTATSTPSCARSPSPVTLPSLIPPRIPLATPHPIPPATPPPMPPISRQCSDPCPAGPWANGFDGPMPMGGSGRMMCCAVSAAAADDDGAAAAAAAADDDSAAAADRAVAADESSAAADVSAAPDSSAAADISVAVNSSAAAHMLAAAADSSAAAADSSAAAADKAGGKQEQEEASDMPHESGPVQPEGEGEGKAQREETRQMDDREPREETVKKDEAEVQRDGDSGAGVPTANGEARESAGEREPAASSHSSSPTQHDDAHSSHVNSDTKTNHSHSHTHSSHPHFSHPHLPRLPLSSTFCLPSRLHKANPDNPDGPDTARHVSCFSGESGADSAGHVSCFAGENGADSAGIVSCFGGGSKSSSSSGNQHTPRPKRGGSFRENRTGTRIFLRRNASERVSGTSPPSSLHPVSGSVPLVESDQKAPVQPASSLPASHPHPATAAAPLPVTSAAEGRGPLDSSQQSLSGPKPSDPQSAAAALPLSGTAAGKGPRRLAKGAEQEVQQQDVQQ